MAKPVPSRRAFVAERRARQIAIVAVIIALVLGIFFLFVVLPLIFRFAIDRARGQASPDKDTFAPQAPVFTPPAEFSNSTQFELAGFTEPEANVSLLINELSRQEQKAGTDGAFRFSLSLTEGEYVVAVTATDEAGNISRSVESPITIDVTPPDISVTNPSSGTSYTLPSQRSVTIEGTASEAVTVTALNARTVTHEAGTFKLPIQLAQGDNQIEIKAKDQAGNESEPVQLMLRYYPQQ